MITSDLAVDYGHLHSAGGSFAPSPDQLNLICVLGGRISLDFGARGKFANDVRDSYLYLPESNADLEWTDFRALALRIPKALVCESAAATTGLPADQLRFLSPRPVSPAHGRLWLETAKATWRDLKSRADSEISVLEHQAVVNLTAAAVVTSFPHTAMIRGYLPGPGDVRPAAVRRAVAYIDAHASLPITVTDIAEAAGASPRAIRAAFRRDLDTTPTDYLRLVRLEAAHRDLEEADPTSGITITSIAARWGFGPRSHFDTQYRARFGRTPAQTLLSEA